MRVAFLVPAPDYPEPWRWAYDRRGRGAFRRGCRRSIPVAWTEAGRSFGLRSDPAARRLGLSLRLRALARFPRPAEAERLPVVNPLALLRWNGDKSYLAGASRITGVPTVPTMAVEALLRRGPRGGAAAVRTPSGWSSSRRCRQARRARSGSVPIDSLPDESRGWRDDHPAADRGDCDRGRIFADAVRRRIQPRGRQAPEVGRLSSPGASWRDDRSQSRPAARRRSRSPSAALAAAPARATYARVDMVPDASGDLMIMELELIEPALFLDSAPDGGAAFAQQSSAPPSARSNSHWRDRRRQVRRRDPRRAAPRRSSRPAH